MTKWIVRLMLVGVLAVAGGAGWKWWRRSESHPVLRTGTMSRGDLLATISATGTIEPEEVIDVGAQVAGKIRNLGTDPKDSSRSIDYGSVIEANTVLAQIDDSLYKAQHDQAAANLERAEADLLQANARLIQRERDWKRAEDLYARSAFTDAQYDAAKAELEVAKATVAVARANVSQARSSLDQAATNLGYTIIRSPVQGIIIDRRVNIGQTVVANLNAPSLFLIAKDLRRLQVWAAVNEADVGQIRPGQPVRFTVDAFPEEAFLGEVAQIRLNATMTQNVVTYTVVVSTDNASGKLLPYLTANLQFEIAKHAGVLLAPNAALRWKPRPALIDPRSRGEYLASQAAAGEAAKSNDTRSRRQQGTLWVPEGEFVRPVEVKLGLSDSSFTEILEGAIEEGATVVINEEELTAGAPDTTNPFAPPVMRGRRSM